MNHIRLNGTDIKVSRVALGTATFGKDADEKTSFMLMDRFVHNGGNLIDTAVMYADWLPGEKSASEKTIGKWMKERENRHDIIISTKGGHPQWDKMEISRLSEADIMSDIDKSLNNLQTDYIDVYFLHCDDKKSREQFYKVRDISEKYNCSAGAVIVSALSSNPYFKTIPIIGCMTESQVDDSMSGLKITMSEDDIKNLISRD